MAIVFSAPHTAAWEPFQLMRELFQEEPTARLETFRPHFDVRENSLAYVFQADLPGVPQENLDIQLDGRQLTVNGKRETTKPADGEKVHLLERGTGAFSRVFTLPENVDAENVRADFRDGVLVLTVPKRPERQPKKIAISS